MTMKDDTDPCPLCGADITHAHPAYTDPASIHGVMDLGWRLVRITEYPTPTLVRWRLDPCGCILPATDWGYLSLPGESIHWLHPDEIDRRLSDWRSTDTT